MTDLEAKAIHRQLLSRDPVGLDRLVDLVGHQAYRVAQLALAGVGNEQDIEEAVSDALAAAWERAAEFDPQRSTLTNWVLMLAKYAALNRRRAIRRRSLDGDGQVRVLPLATAPEPITPDEPADLLVQSEDQAAVHAALQHLPEADRHLLIRRYFFEEPVAEMARDLGLSRGALDTRLWRARQSLKALLNSEREGYAHDR